MNMNRRVRRSVISIECEALGSERSCRPLCDRAVRRLAGAFEDSQPTNLRLTDSGYNSRFISLSQFSIHLLIYFTYEWSNFI